METLIGIKESVLEAVAKCNKYFIDHDSLKPVSLKVNKRVIDKPLGVYKVNTSNNSDFSKSLMECYYEMAPLVDKLAEVNKIRKQILVNEKDMQLMIEQGSSFILDSIFEMRAIEQKLSKIVDEFAITISNLERELNQMLFKSLKNKMISIEDSQDLIKCMSTTHAFIPLGTMIVKTMLGALRMDASSRSTIRTGINQLKVDILKASINLEDSDDNIGNKTTNVNAFQTFAMFPKGKSQSLNVHFKRWFGIDFDFISIETLKASLVKVSGILHKPIGVVIVQIDYDIDYYYEVEPIFDPSISKQLDPPVGVNELYVNTRSNTLKSEIPKRKIPNGTLVVYSDENAKLQSEMYLLWTYDNETFKARPTSIPNNVAHRILSREPSELVGVYNQVWEHKLANHFEDVRPMVTFKETKTVAFESSDDEQQFMKRALAHLITRIEFEYKTREGVLATPRRQFIDFVINSLSNWFDQDPLTKSLEYNIRSRAIYESEAYNSGIFIYETLNNRPTKTIEQIVNMLLTHSNNVYSKFIASHYLNLSSRVHQPISSDASYFLDF